jgi:diguanylate cyclase (GGDEF)-like protein/PAS domain S-box-containing protein
LFRDARQFCGYEIVFPPKVLIVNDNPGALLGMHSILENAPQAPQYRIFTAQSGEDALRAVLQHDFAVILMDVKMPGMDGFAAAEAIHAHPRSAAVPIIFISAYLDDDFSRLKGYEHGAVDFMPAPIVPQILIAKVLVFVELTRQRLELQMQSRELREANRKLSKLNRIAKENEQRVGAEKERLTVTLNAIGDAIGDSVITADTEGCITYLNRAAITLTGWQNDEAAGKPFEEVFNAIEKAKDKDGKADNLVQLALLTRSSVTALGSDIWIKRRDGRKTLIDMSAAPLRVGDGTVIGVVHVARDITHVRRVTAELQFRASHDPLTGLINRAEFERRLMQAVDSANIENKQHALLYLDLDRFKAVNDTCGHDAGDELLRKVTQALLRELRQSDTLARLGGDEFGVLLDGCSDEPALRIAEQLRGTVDEFRFTHREQVFSIGVSIGVAVFGPGNAKLSAIMRSADAACYAAKKGGRNRVHLHGPGDSLEHGAKAQRREHHQT